jgi:hypothetical protein
MLVACRLAGRSALAAHHADVSTRMQSRAIRWDLTRFAIAAKRPGFRASPRSVRDGPCLVLRAARAIALGSASAGRLDTASAAENRLIVYSSPADPCYVQHGVDRLTSRHAGSALPASTSSSMQRGSAAMPKRSQPSELATSALAP